MVGWRSFSWVHKTAYPSREAGCDSAWGAPSRAGTDPSGARRIRPDFSHVHCKAGSRLFSRAKRDDRPPLPKEEEGEKYKHAWAERPARAAGLEASCCCRCLRLGREVRGCQEVLAPSLHSSVPMVAALSHIPNAILAAAAAAGTAELPARLSSPLAKAKEAAGRGLISSGSWVTAYPGSLQTWPWSYNCKYGFLNSAGQSFFLLKSLLIPCGYFAGTRHIAVLLVQKSKLGFNFWEILPLNK